MGKRRGAGTDLGGGGVGGGDDREPLFREVMGELKASLMEKEKSLLCGCIWEGEIASQNKGAV